MNVIGFLDYLFMNRSEVFPSPANEGQAHMDLNGKIYAYFNNRWQEVEDIAFDYEERAYYEYPWVGKEPGEPWSS